MTEAQAEELVNSHRALYEQALKRRESIANASKKKCLHALSGVPPPKKGGRSAKPAKKNGKKQGKKGGGEARDADNLPDPETTQEPPEPESYGGQPTGLTFLQQLDANSQLDPPPLTSSQQQHDLHFLADATTGALAGEVLTDNRSAFDKELDESSEANQKIAAAEAESETLRTRVAELEAELAVDIPEKSPDNPMVNIDVLTKDKDGNVILKTSLISKEFSTKALETYTWLSTPVEQMEFFPTWEVFQPHLIVKYRLCGVNHDEYFFATGGKIEYEKLAMKVIKTKRSNTHKKIRFYA
ncbi:unnamed protein product [Closterium sp. Yama58-4]|nr:unnamed protein product [Closterium sp. Yama58-4]